MTLPSSTLLAPEKATGCAWAPGRWECYRANEFLRVVQRLVGLTRLHLITKIGRKTFVTLKLYQGVPGRTIMQATGHQTEEAFNAYVGVDELKLLKIFMRKSQRRLAASGGK
jgi:hypothetical protein